MKRQLLPIAKILLIVLSAPFFLGSCLLQSTVEGSGYVTYPIEGSHSLSLDIETRNGSVEVIEDQSATEIQVLAEYRAAAVTRSEARERLDGIRVTVERDGDGVYYIRPELPGGWKGRDSVSLEVLLPRLGDVRVNTSNGRIRLEGATGACDLRSSNGSITVEGTRGKLEIETSNGAIAVTNHAGGLGARSSNGAIRVALAPGSQGPFQLSSSNGAVAVDLSSGWQGLIHSGTSNGSLKHYSGGELVASYKVSMQLQLGSSSEVSTISTSNGSVKVRER